MFKSLWAVCVTLILLYLLYPGESKEEVEIQQCTLVRESAYRQRLECELSNGRIVQPLWSTRFEGRSKNCYGKSAEGCYGH